MAASLRLTCDLMKAADLPTAGYRQLLIEATGEITGDVLDFDVARGLLEKAKQGIARWFESRGPSLLSQFGVFMAILGLFLKMSNYQLHKM